MKIKVKEEAIFKNDENGDILVINIIKDDNSYYKITGVAKEAWRKFSNGLGYQEVKKELLDEYDVSEDQIKKDLDAFIDSLKKLDLIVFDE